MSVAIVIALLLVIIAVVAIVALFGCILEAMGEGLTDLWEHHVDPVIERITDSIKAMPWYYRWLGWCAYWIVGWFLWTILIGVCSAVFIGIPVWLIFF